MITDDKKISKTIEIIIYPIENSLSNLFFLNNWILFNTNKYFNYEI